MSFFSSRCGGVSLKAKELGTNHEAAPQTCLGPSVLHLRGVSSCVESSQTSVWTENHLFLGELGRLSDHLGVKTELGLV